MGSAELACASLRALAEAGFCEVVAVVTQPDKPRGRDLKLHPTPVGALAEQLELPVQKPRRARDPDFIQSIRSLHPDLVVVVAYGQILTQDLLDVPKVGCLNVHTSLLPKYRGAAPIQWALVDGESETGVTIMKMDAGLDTGDIVSESRTAITAEDTAQTLHDRLAILGANLLVATIPDFVSGRIVPRKQPEAGASYARKISKMDGEIDWTRSAQEISRQVRGFTPWPGAFTYLRSGQRRMLLKIWGVSPVEAVEGSPGGVVKAAGDELVVACGQGAVAVTELQREGSRRMGVREFLQGAGISMGVRLG